MRAVQAHVYRPALSLDAAAHLETVWRLRHKADAELVERLYMAMLANGKLRGPSVYRRAVGPHVLPLGGGGGGEEMRREERWREQELEEQESSGSNQAEPFHLVVQWFYVLQRAHAREWQQRDIDDALRLNLALQVRGLLARPIHALLESEADAAALRARVPEAFATEEQQGATPPPPPRVAIVVVGERLSFARAFRFANEALRGKLCAIANADIYFDWTLRNARRFLGGGNGEAASTVLALLKWEENRVQGGAWAGTAQRQPVLLPRSDSQDAWLFRSPLLRRLSDGTDDGDGADWLDRCEFSLGTLGCDNRLANVLHSYGGFRVINPALFVRAVHRDSADDLEANLGNGDDAVARYRGRSDANYRSEDCCRFLYLFTELPPAATPGSLAPNASIETAEITLDRLRHVARWLRSDGGHDSACGQSSAAAAASFCHGVNKQRGHTLSVGQCLQVERALAKEHHGRQSRGNAMRLLSPETLLGASLGHVEAFPLRERVYIDLDLDLARRSDADGGSPPAPVNVSVFVDLQPEPIWRGPVPRLSPSGFAEPLFLDRPVEAGLHMLYVVPTGAVVATHAERLPASASAAEAFAAMRARGLWAEAVFFAMVEPVVELRFAESERGGSDATVRAVLCTDTSAARRPGLCVSGALHVSLGSDGGDMVLHHRSLQKVCLLLDGVTKWCRLVSAAAARRPGLNLVVPFTVRVHELVGDISNAMSSGATLRAIAVHPSRRVIGRSRAVTVEMHVEVEVQVPLSDPGVAGHMGTLPAAALRLLSPVDSDAGHHPDAACLAAVAHTNATWLCSLVEHEWGVFAQNGEDGLLAALFAALGQPVTEGRDGSRPGRGYYVEFGTEDGSECNTRWLREDHGWRGLLMDGGHANASIGLHKEWISAEGINALFEKHGVPNDIDLLNIDIDYNDYWVWRAIDETRFSARVVVMEYNGHVPPAEARTVRYGAATTWDGATDYSGAGVGALTKLASSKHYSLVYCESHGVNCIFVRNDVLGFDATQLLPTALVHRPPNYFGRGWSYAHDVTRDWVWV